MSTERVLLADEFNDLPLEALANQKQVAAFLGCSPQKLERERWLGNSLPYVKLGMRSVRYRKADVIQWLASRQVRSTSDPKNPGKEA